MVFVGAGISVPPPSALPLFRELVVMIGGGTVEIDDHVGLDVMLGNVGAIIGAGVGGLGLYGATATFGNALFGGTLAGLLEELGGLGEDIITGRCDDYDPMRYYPAL